MTQAHDFIREFRRIGFGLDDHGKPTGLPEHVRASLEEALAIISKDLYSDDLHFVYELIQNAQDNSYENDVVPNLRFHLLDYDPTKSEDSEGCLVVINNEKGFTEADIKSICSVGKSTKKKKKIEGFIGEKGIGFKSVFKISSNPHIFSNGFQFQLFENDRITGLSYIIPYWVSDIPGIVAENINDTCIVLPLKRGKYEDIKKSLKKHKAEVTLFLEKLKRVEISIPSDNYLALFEEDVEDNILTLTSKVNGKIGNTQKFLISNKAIQVPEGLKEEKRDGVVDRTISIAFPLEKYNSLTVYAYLPTEMRSGLPFLINADFLLAANRESINNTKWNQWLFEEVGNFLVEEISRQAKDGYLSISAYRYIPIVNDVVKVSELFANLAKYVVDLLKDNDFVLSQTNEFDIASSLREPSFGLRRLFKKAKHNVQWIHENVAPYGRQLRQLGLRYLSEGEEGSYYYQTDFIEKQTDDWYVNYYKYLFEGNFKGNGDNFPIIPIEGGGLASIDSSSVYFPIPRNDKKLIEGYFFPEVKTIRESLYRKLKSFDDHEELFDGIELRDFSIGDYFFKIVLNNISDLVDASTHDDKIQLIRFMLDSWNALQVEENIWQADAGLPIHLSDDRLVFSEEISGQVVVPKGGASARGWETIFIDEWEEDQLNILHPWYLDYKADSLDSYYDQIDAKLFPKPLTVEQSFISNLGGYYEEYDKYLNQKFFNDSDKYRSTGDKTAVVPLLPSVFKDIESLDQATYQTLLKYLEIQVQTSRSLKLPLTVVNWRFHGRRSDYIQSPYNQRLLSSPWLKTTQGFKAPASCFIDDVNLRQIFGDSLPYVTASLSGEILEQLGVQKDATTGTIIDYLKTLSGTSDCELETLTAIYRVLSERTDVDWDVFSKSKILFVPSAKGGAPQWCNCTQVIWDDVSQITDDNTFLSLELHYPELLKRFFIEKVKVKESIDAQNYADLWLNLQSNNSLSEREGNLYRKAFSKIRAEILTKSNQPWLQAFRKSAKLYSTKNMWVAADDDPEPFFPDYPPLREAFKSRIPFIQRIDDFTYEHMLPVAKFLGFEIFSEVVVEELVQDFDVSVLPENKYLTDYSLRLLIRLFSNKTSDGRALVDKLVDSGLVLSLFDYAEAEVDVIRIRLSIPHTEIETVISTYSVFLDHENKLLVFRKGADSEDIEDELERLLINQLLVPLLSKQSRDTFEDSIAKILGVRSEKRYRKLLDIKPDWHTPREILTLLDRKIKERKVHRLRQVPVSETGQAVAAEPNKTTTTETGTVTIPSVIKTAPVDEGKGSQAGACTKEKGPFGSSTTSNPTTGGTSGQGDTPSSPSSAGLARTGKDQSGNTNKSPVSIRPSKGSRSRSQGIASSINRARRSRIPVYLASELTQEPNNISDLEAQKIRDELGNQGELEVVNDLQAKGWTVQRMPRGNPGYDIEATNPNTGELLYIEVKGDSFAWCEKGVGISRTQYIFASDKQGAFVLAIVENLRSSPREIHYLRDPVSYITEYRFDHGWRDLATHIPKVDEGVVSTNIHERLLDLTESVACHQLIDFCQQRDFPYPEIGFELVDDKGRVLGELELGWEEERIGVLLTSEEQEEIENVAIGWTFYLDSELEAIQEKLAVIFSRDTGCDD